MKVTTTILLNALERNNYKLLLLGFSQKIIMKSIILLNSELIYPYKNIVNNHVDDKSISVLVGQKKGMPVLCKRGASFKPDIIMDACKILILYHNILVYKLKQPSHGLQLLPLMSKEIKS